MLVRLLSHPPRAGPLLAAADADGLGLLVVTVALVAALYYLRRPREPTSDFYGSSAWMSDAQLRAWGMLGDRGLIVGRTLSGHLIRLPRYCHTLVIGSTGSGKTAGLIIPDLLVYFAGSVVAFDPKRELARLVGDYRRRRGERVVVLDPFGPAGGDTLNPLDAVPRGDGLVDGARAMAAALVVPEVGTRDPHRDAKAAQCAAGVIAGVLLLMTPEDQTLNAVQDIASDPELLWGLADRLQPLGGIPGRMGSQLRGLFEKPGVYSREGASVLSTLARHLAFLDSERVAANVAVSTWDVTAIRRRGTTVFLSIPEEQLQACKGLLRVWTATLVNVMGASGEGNETLFLLDECSALGGLPAIESALVRGRSAGVRLVMSYQSESQVRAAFPHLPTLIPDSCDTHIHMGINGSEGAERLSKALGSGTRALGSWGTSESWSRSSHEPGSGSATRGTSTTTAFHERPLMRVEELLRLGDDFLVATHRGLPQPVLARRVKWYMDPAFNPGHAKQRPGRRVPRSWAVGWVLAAVLLALVVRAKVNGHGYWQPEPNGGERWRR